MKYHSITVTSHCSISHYLAHFLQAYEVLFRRTFPSPFLTQTDLSTCKKTKNKEWTKLEQEKKRIKEMRKEELINETKAN